MNSRERVLKAINHQEPDRVPVDLGSLDVSGINAIAYKKLRSHLGLQGDKIRITCVLQQIAEVEKAVLKAVGADLRGVFIKANDKSGFISDGSPCLVPETWNPEIGSDSSEIVKDEQGNILYLRPSGGHFFEPVYYPLRDCDTITDLKRHADDIENIGINWNLPRDLKQAFREAREFAEEVRQTSDYAIIGSNFAGNIFAGAQGLRGWDVFLLDLLERPAFAEALMDQISDVYCKRFDEYWNILGPYLDVLQISDDLGTQSAPIISPQMYRKMIKPYHQKLFTHIKKKSDVTIVMHTDGSVYKLIPDLIEAGIDFINPVQASASDMDTKKLKKEFGDVLGFWGGGCDTQRILPFGSRQEVIDEVKKRIDDLAPGGGFIFNQVHNILPDVPPENIMAMYEAVCEFGKY